MSEWQPIETAPKGKGIQILLGEPGGYIIVGFWNERTGAWDDGDFRSSMKWPTHWMPLPNPPADKARDA